MGRRGNPLDNKGTRRGVKASRRRKRKSNRKSKSKRKDDNSGKEPGKNGLWSHTIRFSSDLERRKMRYWAENTAKVIAEKHTDEILRAPCNNKPKPQTQWKVPVNTFCGHNKAINANGELERRNYGYMSSKMTGLDQRKVKIHPFPPEMITLGKILEKQLKKQGLLGPHDYLDMAGVKNYVVDSKLREHQDVEYFPDGTPKRHNLQKPKTPTVIVTVGANKILKFQKCKWNGSHSFDKVPNCTVSVLQGNCHCFFLHWNDEIPMQRDGDAFMSFYRHGASLEKKGGVSMAICFRVGFSNEAVADDATLLHPGKTQKPCTDKKFDQVATQLDSPENLDEFLMHFAQLLHRFG